MRKIILLIVVAVSISFGFVIQQSFLSPKVVSGQVYDCNTKQPIANATVLAAQQGWGWNNYLVWDKDYSTRTLTDTVGAFRLEFNHGNFANLIVTKDNYRKAFQNELPNLGVKVGLIPGATSENSYNCITEEECMETRMEGDVEIGWNKCTDPEPKPYNN